MTSMSIFAIDTPKGEFTIAAIGQTEALVAALVNNGDREPIGYTVHQVPGVSTSLVGPTDGVAKVLAIN